jgi:hypothetical protein
MSVTTSYTFGATVPMSVVEARPMVEAALARTDLS